MTQALVPTLALATLTCPRPDPHSSPSSFSLIHAGITWELAAKFEGQCAMLQSTSANLVCLGGKLSGYKALLDEFVASMLSSSWGKGKKYPLERLVGNKIDKSVIAKPGFEWLSNERDSDECKSDDPQACARANRSRNHTN
jgi:hypothetical protein